MYYEDQNALHVVGQLLIAFLFLGTGIVNASTKFQQHLDRMVAANVPFARETLIFGFAMQFAGGFMLLFDYRTPVGAAILIVFLIAATAIFHRFWLVEDPLRRHFHVSFIFSNCGLVGGLLLLM